jgi:hypothetical protein
MNKELMAFLAAEVRYSGVTYEEAMNNLMDSGDVVVEFYDRPENTKNPEGARFNVRRSGDDE